MKTCLVDTGAFIAYFDSADARHERVFAAFDAVRPIIRTTMPVITESIYMLNHIADGPAALVEFLETTGAAIAASSGWQDLRKATALMRKYRDAPMDYPDASLVCLAEDLNLRDILTTDERGFRVFRIHGRQSFHLVLDDFRS